MSTRSGNGSELAIPHLRQPVVASWLRSVRRLRDRTVGGCRCARSWCVFPNSETHTDTSAVPFPLASSACVSEKTLSVNDWPKSSAHARIARFQTPCNAVLICEFCPTVPLRRFAHDNLISTDPHRPQHDSASYSCTEAISLNSPFAVALHLDEMRPSRSYTWPSCCPLSICACFAPACLHVLNVPSPLIAQS